MRTLKETRGCGDGGDHRLNSNLNKTERGEDNESQNCTRG